MLLLEWLLQQVILWSRLPQSSLEASFAVMPGLSYLSVTLYMYAHMRRQVSHTAPPAK